MSLQVSYCWEKAMKLSSFWQHYRPRTSTHSSDHTDWWCLTYGKLAWLRKLWCEKYLFFFTVMTSSVMATWMAETRCKLFPTEWITVATNNFSLTNFTEPVIIQLLKKGSPIRFDLEPTFCSFLHLNTLHTLSFILLILGHSLWQIGAQCFSRIGGFFWVHHYLDQCYQRLINKWLALK